MGKQRHITLTDRRPVLISEDEWEEIGSASGHDGKIEAQATRTWTLKVRQHADGSVIVNGVSTSAFEHEHTWRGGEMLESEDVDSGFASVIAAIRRVAADGGMPDHVIRECIESLPSEEL